MPSASAVMPADDAALEQVSLDVGVDLASSVLMRTYPASRDLAYMREWPNVATAAATGWADLAARGSVRGRIDWWQCEGCR